MTIESQSPVASAMPRGVNLADSSHVSEVLLTIWKELLHITSVREDDDFFELGGDSLAAIRMLERLGGVFGDELLEPDIIYTSSTFGGLVLAIEEALTSSASGEI